MRKGTIIELTETGRQRHGIIRDAQTSEKLFFHFKEGRRIISGGFGPIFHEDLQTREPRVGDAVVFEAHEIRRGPKACPWGYAEEFDATVAECFPLTDRKDAVTYPFLIDLLRIAKRETDDGAFFVRTAARTPDVLAEHGVERYRTKERTHYYAVLNNGEAWNFRSFDSNKWHLHGFDETLDPAPSIAEQLQAHPEAFSNLFAIVKVETPEEDKFGNRYNPEPFPAVWRVRRMRTATIYLA